MTGLVVEKHVILEIACIITEADLKVVGEPKQIVIHQNESVLNNMNQWCIEQHGKVVLFSLYFTLHVV